MIKMADRNTNERRSSRNRLNTFHFASETTVRNEEAEEGEFRRERSRTTVREQTLKELVEMAERRIKELKEKQQGVMSEVINTKSEKQTLIDTIDQEFELLHKMLTRKKGYMLETVEGVMGEYVRNLEGFNQRFDEEMSELDRAVSKVKNQDTAGMNVLELEERMNGIKAELNESISSSRDESIEAALAKSKRPILQFQHQSDRFYELISNIGWVEQKVDYSVRTAIDAPVQLEKGKETLAFLPVDVVASPDGAVYVLDAAKDAGFIHLFMQDKRLHLTNLTKELKIKRPPNSMCVTKNRIYISFPDMDTVAVIHKKVGEGGAHFITPQSLGIKSPHGLDSCDGSNVLIADTGNNRVLVLACPRLKVVQIVSGTTHAPLYAPHSVSGTEEGIVAVLHSGGYSVHIYNISTGELRWRTCVFQVIGQNPTETWVPYRVALSKGPGDQGHEVMLSACYQGEQCLLRYNLRANWLCKEGKTGNKFGQFKDIKGVAFNHMDETILVCDQGNERIQVFDN